MKNKAGKKHIIVIADDITGAAEIAGIAFQHGLTVRLLCSSLSITNPKDVVSRETEVTVIATDTRSMTEAEAVVETRQLTKLITSFFTPPLGVGELGSSSSRRPTLPFAVMW